MQRYGTSWRRWYHLFLHGDPAPERHVVPDRRRRVLRLGVIPGGILVGVPVHHQVVVASLSLPRAGRVGRALADVRALQGVRWKVVIALDHDGLVALGQYRVAPDRLHRCFSSYADRRQRRSVVSRLPGHEHVTGTIFGDDPRADGRDGPSTQTLQLLPHRSG